MHNELRKMIHEQNNNNKEKILKKNKVLELMNAIVELKNSLVGFTNKFDQTEKRINKF